MRRLGALLFTFSCGFATVVACSSADSRPGAATTNTDAAGGGGGGGEGGEDLDATSKGDTASCTNGQKGEAETDTDCGGSLCPPCALNKVCGKTGDCETGLTCTKGLCASCDDGMKDGTESAVDCGGSSCVTCGIGKTCNVAADCASLKCGTDHTCACPDSMTNVSLGLGKGAFCIDATEVTKGEYLKFVSGTDPKDPKTQSAVCLAANSTFVPAFGWPVLANPLFMGTSTKAFNMGIAVHYVDWCDAQAYCKSQSKVLCGKLDGTSLTPAESNDIEKSAWYNACTAQGQNTYPYGSTFNGNNCNGTGTGDQGPDPTFQKDVPGVHFGYAVNQDTGIYEIATSDESGNVSAYEHTTCVGGSTFLYQMSGNVAEWEDNCDGTGATANCSVRGGSYAANNNQAALRCDAARSVPRVPADPSVLADVGIRCCLF